MDPLVSRPVPALAAFCTENAAAHWSRSAQLLLIARQIIADPGGGERPAEVRPIDADEAELAAPLVHRVSDPAALASPAATPKRTPSARELWKSLDSSADPATAIELLRHELDSKVQVVRVSAAASLLALGVETQVADARLREIARFSSPTARALASLCLDLPAPPLARASDHATTQVSIGIAGTFGRWRASQLTPGGALFELLKQNLSPDLYSDRASHYRWTGAFTEAARQSAATDLIRWLSTSASGATLNDVYAHSHGGNVALNALVDGATIDFLCLIDTPALRRPNAEWSLINSRARRAVSLRSRLDLVILLDGLLGGGPGSRGSDGLTFSPQFNCRVLSPPVWFSHTAMLMPRVWAKFNLVEEIRYEMSLQKPASAN